MKEFAKFVSCIPDLEPLGNPGSVEERVARARILFDYGVRWALNGDSKGWRRYGLVSSLDVSAAEADQAPPTG